jgi:carboxyl-terminal processing protease
LHSFHIEGAITVESPPTEPTLAPPPPAAPRPSPLEREPNYGQFFITMLLVALAFTAGWLGNNFANRDYPTPASARPWDKDIWTAWNLIDTKYYNPSAINHQKMTYAMISAMVNSLGDTGHSTFLTPEQAQAETQALNNQSFVGIGIYLTQIQTSSGSIIVLEATIPNSPAAASGLLPGDQFIAVNGTNVVNASLDQFSTLVRGKAGTTVTVTVRRNGVKNPLSFTIKRASITEQVVVYTYFAQDHIGYVQLIGFDAGAAKALGQALQTLQKEGATSLIFDLRDNGGGLVNEAVGVASDFLQPGQTIVYEKDRSGNLTALTVDSDPSVPKGLHLTLPMVVLVNNNTASASEIVTGAIQDNRPTVQVIGERTFGTDTVLVSYQLPSGAELVLGILQYLTPDKHHFSPGVGLTPSKVVALPANGFPQTPLVLSELHLTESDVLACKGVNPDPQLIAAIQALAPARTSTCASR